MIVPIATCLIGLVVGYGLGTPTTVEKTEEKYITTQKAKFTGSVHSSGRINIKEMNTDEDIEMTGSVHDHGTIDCD